MKITILGDPHGYKHKKLPKSDLYICPGDFGNSDGLRQHIFKFLDTNPTSAQVRKFYASKTYKQKIAQVDKQSLPTLKYICAIPNMVITHGNWDSYDFVKKNTANTQVTFVHDSAAFLPNVTIIGYGGTSRPELPLPQSKVKHTNKEIVAIKKEFTQKCKSYDQLFKLAKQRGNPIIFLTHVPPINTKLDLIKNPKSPLNGVHFGSQLVRKLIQTQQPALCVSGHIHESKGKDKIKKTICINAGCQKDITKVTI
jgi:Icc-related predicted phosphoesterase